MSKRFNPDGDGGKFSTLDQTVQAKARRIARKALKEAKKAGERAPQAAPGVVVPELRDRKPEGDETKPNYWCDVSERLLYASRALLFAFVEWEIYNPDNVQVNWEWTAKHRDARREIDKLYLFFKVEQPKRQKEIDRLHARAYRMNRKAWGGEMFEPAEPGAHSRRVKTGAPEATALYKQSWKLEDKLLKDTTEALCRLMRIRGFLWT